MAYNALKTKLKTERKQLRQAADALVAKAESASRAMTHAEQTAFDAAMREHDDLSATLRNIPADKKPDAVARKDTYREDGRYSWFLDRIAAVSQTPLPGNSPIGAAQRLRAHGAETERRARARSEIRSRKAAAHGVMFRGRDGEAISSRDISTASGGAGEFTPPVYLVEHWASIARAAAPLVALADSLPLPDGCMEVVVPEFNAFTGTTNEYQDLENIPQTPANPTSAALTSDVGTITSFLTVSQQVLDRASGPGVLDKILIQEAAEGFAAYWEQALFVGDGIGSGGVYPGIYDTAGIWQQVYNDASPTPTALVLAIGKAAAQVSVNRKRRAEALFCAPARIDWLMANTDTTADGVANRIGTGAVNRPGTDDALTVFGPVAGLPVYASGALDLGGTEDVIFAGRPSDLLVMQGDPILELFAEPYGTQLGVQFRTRTYVADILRYPTGWASVLGTGTVRGAGW
jgi:HK97 family phage major capsid protein